MSAKETAKQTNLWPIKLGLFLILLSASLYGLHYYIFHDPHHIFIYLLGDIAFIPLEVLLVTMIIHEMLNRREKTARLQKLNMVIGLFFSELGTPLLTSFSDADPHLDLIKKELVVNKDWDDKTFDRASKKLLAFDFKIDLAKINIIQLKEQLKKQRDLLLHLLENPNLLEHENFSDLLWAVFHLMEELLSRRELINLPPQDQQHLQIDIKRAYAQLAREWLLYMAHLKNNYPYLFSLAMRRNPFDETAKPEIN